MGTIIGLGDRAGVALDVCGGCVPGGGGFRSGGGRMAARRWLRLVCAVTAAMALGQSLRGGEDPRFVARMARYGIDLENVAGKRYPSLDEIDAHCDRKLSAMLQARFGRRAYAAAKRQVELEHPLYRIGETVTATVGARKVQGRLSRIDENHVRIDGIRINKRDFPPGAFDPARNAALREATFRALYADPRREYIAELREYRPSYREELLRKSGYLLHDGTWMTQAQFVPIARRAFDSEQERVSADTAERGRVAEARAREALMRADVAAIEKADRMPPERAVTFLAGYLAEYPSAPLREELESALGACREAHAAADRAAATTLEAEHRVQLQRWRTRGDAVTVLEEARLFLKRHPNSALAGAVQSLVDDLEKRAAQAYEPD